jgi:signal transduction histidine kinase
VTRRRPMRGRGLPTIRGWPIRVRLTAAFTAVMALVLLGVAAATLAHMRASLDEAISESLTYRLHDLQPEAAAAAPVLPGGEPDTAEQILDQNGRPLASTSQLANQAALDPAEFAAARRGLIMSDHRTAGALAGPIRVAAEPTPGGRKIVVAVQTLADRDAAVADLRGELAIGFPLVLLAAAVGAYLLAGAALRPVERMRARAATITASDPAQRLPVPAARDEIARLGHTFNDLLDRLHAALRREREFVADASHELRTPLSLLTTELELALRRPRGTEALTAALRSALEETSRLSRLAQDLLLLAYTDQADAAGAANSAARVTRLRPVLDAVLARYRARLDNHDAILDCAPELAVRADPEDLDRMISNLLDNALRHGRPPVIIRSFPGPPERAERNTPVVAVDISDHGPGFDPAFLPRAFDRLTRADQARTGGGTGLGLAIVAALTRRNHGTVTAGNRVDGGAALTLTLPAATRAWE